MNKSFLQNIQNIFLSLLSKVKKIFYFLYSIKNKIIHNLFEITIFMKGIHGLWEVAVGFLFFLLKTETIYKSIIFFTGDEIVDGPGHSTINYFIRMANNFSLSTKHFIALYFLFYGLVNIFLVIFLSRGKLWAYPAAITFYIFFIIYQFYRLFLHHSGLLLFFTIFDIFLVFLIWLEYKRLKKGKESLLKL